MTAPKSASRPVIYLDHNSTTPLHPAVLEAMQSFWTDCFGNPASAHYHGQRARQALERAREDIAHVLDADPEEVVFTSGATEANNLALFGLAGDNPAQLVSSPIEHPSVTVPIAVLSKRGFPLATFVVDAQGVISLSTALPQHTEPIRLVTVMLANNETGAIQPIAKLTESLRGFSTYFHCDAAQAVGKLPVSFRQLNVTTLSLSAHKFNGPRGIGALLVRKGTALKPLLWGGHQQHGHRPGTEPVALAVGLAKALELAHQEMAERSTKVRELRQCFLTQLRNLAAPISINGPEEDGLPNTLNLSFPGCDAATLLIKLDLAGVACSTGSACSSGSLLPSPTLQAMNLPPAILKSAMRFSLSHLLSEDDILQAAYRIANAVQQLRISNSGNTL